jgi:hypothetical protein
MPSHWLRIRFSISDKDANTFKTLLVARFTPQILSHSVFYLAILLSVQMVDRSSTFWHVETEQHNQLSRMNWQPMHWWCMSCRCGRGCWWGSWCCCPSSASSACQLCSSCT